MDHRDEFRVVKMCQVFGVSRSGYYAWLKRPKSPQNNRKKQLIKQIRNVYLQSNQIWMLDTTYIHTEEGWLYLASIMDLYTRKIVGWHIDARMTKELVIQALQRALA